MADKEYKIGINVDGLEEGARNVKQLSEEFEELTERVEKGVDAIASLGERTGDAKLERLANDMRAAFKEGIADAGEESIEVLKTMDNAIGDMIVEFAELKKAQDQEAEAARELNEALADQAKGMADAAEAAGRSRKEAQDAISEWSQNSGVQGDDLKRWTDHVEEAEEAAKKSTQRGGGFRSVLDTMDELPGAAGAAAGGLRTALGGGFWGGLVVATTLYLKALSAIADKLADMKRAAGLALPTLETFKDKTIEAKDAQLDMNEALAVGASNSDNYKGSLDRTAQAEQDLIDARTDNAKAQIEVDLASGKITPDEAAQRRAELDIAAAGDKRQVARDALVSKVEEQRRVVGLLEGQAQGFFSPLQAAQTAVDTARNSPVESVAPEEFAARKAAADKLAKAPLNSEIREELKKELEEAQAALNEARQEVIQEAVDKRDALASQRGEAVGRLNQGRGTLRDLETELREFDGTGQDIFNLQQSAAGQRLAAGKIAANEKRQNELADSLGGIFTSFGNRALEGPGEDAPIGERLGALANRVDDGRGTGTVAGASAVALRADAASLSDGATARELREARSTLKTMFDTMFEWREEIAALAQDLKDMEGQATNARGAGGNTGTSR